MQLQNLFASESRKETGSSKPEILSSNVYSPMASLAFKYSTLFGCIAILILILYSMGESSNTAAFLSILGIVIIIAFASIAAGGIIGFLFGIPHTVQQNTLINTPNTTDNTNSSYPASGNNNGTPSGTTGSTTSAQTVTATPSGSSINTNRQTKSNFTPSTNLEQIADWLTKIIVGVGLIEIHKIIDGFNQLCNALGTTLQAYNSSHHQGALVVGCIIILFSIEGFLLVYLWTYLYLIRIQDSMSVSDIIETINSKIAISDVNDKQAIDLASKQLTLPDGAPDVPINELTQAFQNASKNVLSTIFFKAVSVRKQFWKDVSTKYRIEKIIPIFQALIIIDSNFEIPENYAELAFVLKDKREPDYKQALINLDKAIGGFKVNDAITNKAIIFFNRAYCRIKVDTKFTANLPSTPEDKQLIQNDLNEAAKEPYVVAIITNDPIDKTINNWKSLNP